MSISRIERVPTPQERKDLSSDGPVGCLLMWLAVVALCGLAAYTETAAGSTIILTIVAILVAVLTTFGCSASLVGMVKDRGRLKRVNELTLDIDRAWMIEDLEVYTYWCSGILARLTDGRYVFPIDALRVEKDQPAATSVPARFRLLSAAGEKHSYTKFYSDDQAARVPVEKLGERLIALTSQKDEYPFAVFTIEDFAARIQPKLLGPGPGPVAAGSPTP